MENVHDNYAEIAELGAELAHCILTRKPRRETQQRLDQALSEAERRQRETEGLSFFQQWPACVPTPGRLRFASYEARSCLATRALSDGWPGCGSEAICRVRCRRCPKFGLGQSGKCSSSVWFNVRTSSVRIECLAGAGG